MDSPVFAVAKNASTAQSSLVTASFAVTAGDLVLVPVWLGAGTDISFSSPTVSDTFATLGAWTVIPIVNSDTGAACASVFLAYAIAGASESGTVTVGWTTATARARMEVWLQGGANTGAPVTQVTPAATSTGASLTATFSGSPAATSGIFATIAAMAAGATDLDIGEDTGFTQLSEGVAGSTGPQLNYQTMFDPDNGDTTVIWTGLGSNNAAGLAIEIAAAAANETLTFTTQPQNTQEDTVMANIVVESSDPTATDIVTLSIGENPGSGTASGTLAKAMVAGSVTFTDVEINNPGVGYTFLVNAPGHDEAESAAFDITLEPATHLYFHTGPSNTQVGAIIVPSIVIRLRNSENQVDTNATDEVTLAVQTGTGALGGDLVKNAVAGVVTFDDVTYDTIETGVVLRATAAGLTLADSAAFDVTASPPPSTRRGFGIRMGSPLSMRL